MPTAAQPDVLIIGAGPAGLATAIAAAQHGLRVTLADAASPPFDKACGEGLMPSALPLLRDLGLDLAATPHHPFRGIRFLDDRDAPIAEARFATPGIGLRRTTLSTLLLHRASTLGVDFLWNSPLRALTAGSPLTAHFDRAAISSPFLIGADGSHSTVRRLARLRAPRCLSRRIGQRRHFHLAPWSDLVEVHWAARMQAYVTPVSPTEIGIAILSRQRSGSFDHLLAQFPALAARLRAASPASVTRGAATNHTLPAAITAHNIALIGDASASVDAITGDGITLALHQAFALANALASADLRPYAAAHREIFRPARLASAGLLLLDRSPVLRRRTIAAFAGNPELFASMLKLHTSSQTPRLLGQHGILGLGLHIIRA